MYNDSQINKSFTDLIRLSNKIVIVVLLIKNLYFSNFTFQLILEISNFKGVMKMFFTVWIIFNYFLKIMRI